MSSAGNSEGSGASGAKGRVTSEQPGLLEILSNRLEQSGLSEEAQLIVWAAIEGEATLNQFVTDTNATIDGIPPEAATPPTPPRAYLDKISAQSFRGIGPKASLPLNPGPRLVLVVGRNGSGKSSFAEAAEIALTGANARWVDKSQVWRQGWRNLHDSAPPEVDVSLQIDGDRGSTSVHRSWSGDDVRESACWVQRPGKRRAELASLGWDAAIKTHRPFLSYAELGQMISGRPSDAYDALASILGLDRLATAEKSLLAARKSLKEEIKKVDSALDLLLNDLRECDDPRAGETVQALSGRAKDLVVARRLASGSETQEDPGLAGLRRMARLEPPSRQALDETAKDLSAAADGLAAIRGTAADDARSLADLLQRAVDHHQRHQDQATCVVCGTSGMLTEEWAVRTQEEIERLRAEALRAESAHQAVRQGVAVARRLIPPMPDWLPAESPVRAAWQAWTDGADIDNPADLAEHISSAGPALLEACRAAIEEAERQLAKREDRWRPFRGRLASWLDQWEEADTKKRRHADVDAAYTWLKKEGVKLRNMRLAPLAHEAQRVWQDLRQQSNVDLGEIRLSGAATNRSVEYSVEIDGVRTAALSVMSQGELHALALSIFLPRATVPESPFGFLMIDDPVQSMDPAKVDGLAQVLHRYAQARQVIVFTHDTRLSDAVRHLQLPATILEVQRRERSEVEVRTVGDAVSQAMRDGNALIRTPGLPAKVAMPVVSGLCRTALEAAITEVVWRRRLREGAAHAAVQDEIDDARGFYELAALALYGTTQRDDRVIRERVRASFGPAAVGCLRDCLTGVHTGSVSDLQRLLREVEELAEGIRREW